MNDLGLIVLGLAARATVLALAGLAASSLLRRRGADAGALACSTTMVVLVGIVALAFSPWPRWWPSGGEPVARNIGPGAMPSAGPAASADVRTDLRADPAAPASTFAAVPVTWSDFAREFARELAKPADPAGSTSWRWPAWVAVGFLSGLMVASIRLGLGLWAVRTLRDRSRPIVDPGLLDLVSALRSDLGLVRPVDVRETSEVGTPATIGWLRPAILLPEGWAEWDEAERRAVLAHELAHIVRGDYPAGLLAQVGLSLHFYHPLVHALAGRFRLQQELAADAWGARLAGGRRPYLTALANLALRQDPRPSAWPSRPFLPTRGTFLRRIEMLRDPKALQQSPLLARGRLVTVSGLVVAGLLVAGLRGPASPSRAIAQEQGRTPPTARASAPLDASTAASDAHLVVDIRPAMLLKNPDFKKLVSQLPNDGHMLHGMILSGDLEQFLVLGFERPEAGPPPRSSIPAQLAFVFRASKPTDWKPLMEPGATEVKDDGFAYFRAGSTPGSTCFRVLDDRTLLMGNEADVKVPPIGGDRPKGKHAWDDAWSKVGPGSARVAFDTPWLVRQIRPGQPGGHSPMTSIFAPLFDKAGAYALNLGVVDNLTLEAVATCGSEEGAGRVVDTVRASLALARNALPDLRGMVERGHAGTARPMSDLVDALDALLDSAKVEQDKSVARLHAKGDASAVATAARMLVPAIGASREAARRAQCVNSLKQLALAMHNYHSTNNCFPPAVLYGPDGKTPYSWRVALLPYLEANDLYKEYKFDEPWDGPNNSKLIPRMPALFACPDDAEALASHRTSYFALTGPDTLFPVRREGMKLLEITDGTSNTILFVEAKRDVPWTKPEDIPYDAKKPIPAPGGLHPGGYDVSMADGSVRFFSDKINEQTLRALISRAGGEVVSYPIP